ncbi:hypothetical protein M2138_001848 [Dysgonomonadaceae bacterium PH5-43]|nr:hypothetical protein [Dysgonomonadaceae bacterium PH5-43]
MRNNKNATLILFALLLFVGGLSSCKSPKQSTSSAISLESMNAEDRFNNILKSSVSYNTLSSNLKFTLKASGGRSISLNAQLKIVKDELIQISLLMPVFNSEAARIVITPDEVIFFNRMQKQYVQESTNTLKSKMKLDSNASILEVLFTSFDYYSLEALLTNQLFIAGNKKLSSKDWKKLTYSENDYLVKFTNVDKVNTKYHFTSDYTDRIQETLIVINDNAQLVCKYSDWKTITNDENFPTTMKFLLNASGSNTNVDLDFKSVNLNTKFVVDNKIPNKYKRVSLQGALGAVRQLL